MNIGLWLLLYIANTAFAVWVVWGGGAARFTGWRAWLLVDWLFAREWSPEQIAFYTLVVWVGHSVWFVVGLFVPQARFFF